MLTSDLGACVEQLQSGGLVAIPTETVYGLGADAFNEAAVQKVFALKNRPMDHPLILHVASDWDLTPWVTNIPDYANRLMRHFWPGPLTMIFKARPGGISKAVTGGEKTIAIRAPKHPLTEALLKQFNHPLVAPSANPFTKLSPTRAEDVAATFQGTDLKILQGGRCAIGLESTIIDATHPEFYQILRQGMISEQNLRQVIPEVELLSKQNDMKVPGKMAQHYQPQKPLYYATSLQAIENFCDAHPNAVYVLSFQKLSNPMAWHYQFPSDRSRCAYEFYYQLRQADASEAKMIVIELPNEPLQWAAMTDRIYKAGQPVP